MGVTVPAPSASARPELAQRVIRPLAVATLVSNIAIVVTGGAVRLTASGLGCPTWPRCTAESFVPHGALGAHGAIEFGNRMMTFVLAAIAVATWLAAMNLVPRSGSVRRLATVLALGIPGQAVIGGITVLTDLNPWIVGLHLMLSMGMIAVAVLLLFRLRPPGPPEQNSRTGTTARRLAIGAFATTFLVLYLGTVVTGSGPHAGDIDAPRNGLDSQVWSHVHASAVYALTALVVALLVVLRRSGVTGAPWRSSVTLAAVVAAQATIGFVQYFLDLPVLLVGLHLVGAAVLTATVSWVLLSTLGTASVTRARD
jgi:heme a synthase